jgi:glutathionylspermidine synthase
MLAFERLDEQLQKEELEKIGFSWHSDSHGAYLVGEKMLLLRQAEAEAYYEAAAKLYEMYEVATEYVIEKELFGVINITKNLIEIIKKSWSEERGNHLYGRFDLSGGIDGKAIKLIEFNADTPTMLLESSVIQWMLLQKNGRLKGYKQFNNIYEAIGEKLLTLSASSPRGEFSTFLFSSVADIAEESNTTKLLLQMAKDRGLLANFAPLQEVCFEEEYVVDAQESRYDFWFKLFPWEEMLAFEGKLKTSVLNPAYTLLYQSKGMLAILWQLFPESPYLLESSFEPIEGKYVRKRMFGREGANIEIVDNNATLLETEGAYEEYDSIYQEYVDFVRDDEGLYYQAGLFYSEKPCGLGFRRGAEILDDSSQFIGHLIKE